MQFNYGNGGLAAVHPASRVNSTDLSLTFTSKNGEHLHMQAAQQFQSDLMNTGFSNTPDAAMYDMATAKGLYSGAAYAATGAANGMNMYGPTSQANAHLNKIMMSASGQHENMLGLYKQATEANNKSLREARNLEELVGIKVLKVDGAAAQAHVAQMGNMAAAGRAGVLDALNQGEVNRRFDPKQDPVLYRQKVPCLGDRRFLINQAILSSSVPSQRVTLGLKSKGGRQTSAVSTDACARTQAGYGAPGSGNGKRGGPLTSGGSTDSFQRFKDECDKNVMRTKGLGGVDDVNSKIDKMGNIESAPSGAPDGADGLSRDSHSKKHLSEQHDFEGGKLGPKDGKEPDPIGTLKSIFKPDQVRKRRVPLDLNPISSKYRMQARQQAKMALRSEREALMSGSANDMSMSYQKQPTTQKVFKEDFPDQDGQINVATPIDSAVASSAGLLGAAAAAAQYPESSIKNLDVKGRLENLRKLFAEEDMNEAVQEIQAGWDLEDQKQTLEKEGIVNANFISRPQELNDMLGHMHEQKISNLPQDQDLPSNDLRNFLANKIREVQDRSDPLTLAGERVALDQGKLEVVQRHDSERDRIMNQVRGYKASTLTHIAQCKYLGQTRLEEQYLERVCREMSDYHQERYNHNKQKQTSKRVTFIKKQKAELAPTEGADPFAGVVTTPKETAPVGFQSRIDRTGANNRDIDSSQGAPFELKSAGMSSMPSSSKYRSRPRKNLNVIQENLQKIDKIDRGQERGFISQKADDVNVVTSIIDAPHQIHQVQAVEVMGESRDGSPGRAMNTTHQTHIMQDHELAASSMTHKVDVNAAPGAATAQDIRNIVQTREIDGQNTEVDVAMPAGSAQTHYTSEAMVGIGSTAGESFTRRAAGTATQNIREGRNSVPTDNIRQDAQALIHQSDVNETEQAVSRIDGDRASTQERTAGPMKIQDTNSKINGAESTITTHMAPVVAGAEVGGPKAQQQPELTVGFTLKKGPAGQPQSLGPSSQVESSGQKEKAAESGFHSKKSSGKIIVEKVAGSPKAFVQSVPVNVVNQNLASGLKEFRVSQLVQEFNYAQMMQRGFEGSPKSRGGLSDDDQDLSPFGNLAYLSDSELVVKARKNFRKRESTTETKGGGFTVARPKPTSRERDGVPPAPGSPPFVPGGVVDERQARAARHRYRSLSLESQRQAAAQLQALGGYPVRHNFGEFGVAVEPEVVNGNQFQYFCPKRFNRYPRFTIFFKKDQAMGGPNGNQLMNENTVSLSPQFLSYLMDKNSEAAKIAAAEALKNEQMNQAQQPGEQPATDISAGQNKGEPPEMAPQDAVTGWNQHHDGSLQSYDPFERVVLVKGIDNSILTSFRTLKRENNTVSETYKIVHKKFQPLKQRGAHLRAAAKNLAHKAGLYALTDNEDALDMAQAELLAESFLQQAEESQQPNQTLGAGTKASNRDIIGGNLTRGSGLAQSEANRDQPSLQEDGRRMSQKTSGRQKVASKAYPLKLANVGGNEKSAVIENKDYGRPLDPGSRVGGPTSGSQNSSLGLGGALRPAGMAHDLSHFEREGVNEQSAVTNTNDRLSEHADDKILNKNETQATAKAPTRAPKDSASMAQVSSTAQNNKHQIEVMVLSKVDPFDSAFPDGRVAQGSEPNLAQLANQPRGTSLSNLRPANSAATSQVMQNQQFQNGKRNPFKGPGFDGNATAGTEVSNTAAQLNLSKLHSGQQDNTMNGESVLHDTVPRSVGKAGALNDSTMKAGLNVTSQVRTVVRQRNQQAKGLNNNDNTATSNALESNVLLNENNNQDDDASGLDDLFLRQGPTHEKTGDNMSLASRVQERPTNIRPSPITTYLTSKSRQKKRPKKDDLNTSKYGKDFKIPELPPILAAQLFPDGVPNGASSLHRSNSLLPPVASGDGTVPTFGSSKPYRIKRFIDEIYQKEAKSRYHKQYVREDFLSTKSPIFDLQKFHALRPRNELVTPDYIVKQQPKPYRGPHKNRFGGYKNKQENMAGPYGAETNQLDMDGKPLLYASSQSLTNVLGFQAGGPNVIPPSIVYDTRAGVNFIEGPRDMGRKYEGGPSVATINQGGAHPKKHESAGGHINNEDWTQEDV